MVYAFFKFITGPHACSFHLHCPWQTSQGYSCHLPLTTLSIYFILLFRFWISSLISVFFSHFLLLTSYWFYCYFVIIIFFCNGLFMLSNFLIFVFLLHSPARGVATPVTAATDLTLFFPLTFHSLFFNFFINCCCFFVFLIFLSLLPRLSVFSTLLLTPVHFLFYSALLLVYSCCIWHWLYFFIYNITLFFTNLLRDNSLISCFQYFFRSG